MIQAKYFLDKNYKKESSVCSYFNEAFCRFLSKNIKLDYLLFQPILKMGIGIIIL